MSALNVTIMKSYLAFIILLWSGLPSDIDWKYSLYPELCSPHSAGTGSGKHPVPGPARCGSWWQSLELCDCACAVQDLLNNNLLLLCVLGTHGGKESRKRSVCMLENWAICTHVLHFLCCAGRSSSCAGVFPFPMPIPVSSAGWHKHKQTWHSFSWGCSAFSPLSKVRDARFQVGDEGIELFLSNPCFFTIH